MPAKDWPPLRNALWRHVREPLIHDYPDDWNPAGAGGTIPFNRLSNLANGGRISTTSPTATIRWYTLAYGCQHFDSLRTLMRRREFQEPLQLALGRSHEQNIWHRMGSILGQSAKHARLWPRLLHIDFGCGPGTASWAVIEDVADRAALATVGHDHNPNMISLANAITGDLTNDRRHLDSLFFSDWHRFNRQIRCLTTSRWTAVLITVNSLFAQDNLNTDVINRIVDLVAMVDKRVRDAPLIAIGTHPNYDADAVNGAWQRLADVAGLEVLYNEEIEFQSWNPICPGAYAPEDHGAWSRWRGDPRQLGHIFGVRNG